jgi:2-polyprenyl-3-methyl-5-hydroxy-6-metoxy-1,4-benzoquinol methylase
MAPDPESTPPSPGSCRDVNPRAERSDWFWDWRARRYDRNVPKDATHARTAARLAKHLRPGDAVLDFACGTGVMSHEIAARVGTVHGIDLSAGMIGLAQQRRRERRATNVRFARASIFDARLRTSAYDVVLALNILHLVEDAPAFVQRATALLRPGGLIVSVTPCLAEANVVLRTLVPLISKVGVLSVLTPFSASEAADLLHGGPLRVLESEILEGTIPSCFVVGRKHP